MQRQQHHSGQQQRGQALLLERPGLVASAAWPAALQQARGLSHGAPEARAAAYQRQQRRGMALGFVRYQKRRSGQREPERELPARNQEITADPVRRRLLHASEWVHACGAHAAGTSTGTSTSSSSNHTVSLPHSLLAAAALSLLPRAAPDALASPACSCCHPLAGAGGVPRGRRAALRGAAAQEGARVSLLAAALVRTIEPFVLACSERRGRAGGARRDGARLPAGAAPALCPGAGRRVAGVGVSGRCRPAGLPARPRPPRPPWPQAGARDAAGPGDGVAARRPARGPHHRVEQGERAGGRRREAQRRRLARPAPCRACPASPVTTPSHQTPRLHLFANPPSAGAVRRPEARKGGHGRRPPHLTVYFCVTVSVDECRFSTTPRSARRRPPSSAWRSSGQQSPRRCGGGGV